MTSTSDPTPTYANPLKVVVVGAGPVGALAALYAAKRGHQVDVYELREGTYLFPTQNPENKSQKKKNPNQQQQYHQLQKPLHANAHPA